jgi:hypothetical protein
MFFAFMSDVGMTFSDLAKAASERSTDRDKVASLTRKRLRIS